MTHRLLALVLVPNAALAEPSTLEAEVAGAEQGLAKLTTAIRTHDARAIQRQLANTVHFHGAWFTDTACRKRFARREVVKSTAARAALAKCLAGVKLQPSTRRSAAGDGAVLTIAPGVELELAFDGTRVRWLSFAGQHAEDDLLPTLTAQAFETLRTAGGTRLDASLKKQLDATVARSGSASAWLRLCLDATGAVTSATVREIAPELEIVRESFAAAVADWKFKPFIAGGIATPACSLSLLTYPSAKAPAVETLPIPAAPAKAIVRKVGDDLDGVDGGEEGVTGGLPPGPPPPPPPPPPPAPQPVPPQQLETLRIAGERKIRPDAATLKAMTKAGQDRLIGAFRFCLTASGAVSSVKVVKSTGFPSYDKAITTAMRAWKFKPYLINGKATPICSAQTFLYRK